MVPSESSIITTNHPDNNYQAKDGAKDHQLKYQPSERTMNFRVIS
jgi:hypothetical protein